MSLRKLAGETAIYGLSSIIGRMLYFLLTPLYTGLFSPEEYGAMTLLFSLISFLMIAFTYRMEVSYFRFGSDNEHSAKASFNTGLLSITGSTLLFGGVLLLATPWLADVMKYPTYEHLFTYAILILCLDALVEIPLARLRLEGRPIRFAVVRLSSILVNLGLNLFFLWLCPFILKNYDPSSGVYTLVETIYNPDFGIGYIFLANLVGSAVSFLLLLPYFLKIKFTAFDWKLLKEMLIYAAPLIIVGFSYVINELFDRLMMTHWAPGTLEERKEQLGIYAANYKLAMIISLFTQAFRYGAEPFFFRQRNQANAMQLYADLAKFFAIAGATAFLIVMLYIDLFKYFIRTEQYWEGLDVVPILLLANVFLGLYYNFSVWYKVTDQTRWGAYISIGGAVVTIVLNAILLPRFGYIGAAWATLVCYFSMTIASHFFGKEHYPVPYDLGRIGLYIGLAVLGYFNSELFRQHLGSEQQLVLLVLNTIMLGIYLGLIYFFEKESIHQYFKRT